MGFGLIGKNARTGINLSYTEASAYAAVLAELLGKEVYSQLDKYLIPYIPTGVS